MASRIALYSTKPQVVPRRRRWSAKEKATVVQETYAPGMSVSLVAQRHGIAPN
jgi:transposase